MEDFSKICHCKQERVIYCSTEQDFHMEDYGALYADDVLEEQHGGEYFLCHKVRVRPKNEQVN